MLFENAAPASISSADNQEDRGMKSEREPFPGSKDLDFSGFGYWVAAAVDAPRPEGVKSYFDTSCHGMCPGHRLLEEIMDRNRVAAPGWLRLLTLARALEKGPDPDLAGGVIQVRNMRDPLLESQAKIYLRPTRLEGIGIRRAAGRIADILRADHGPEKAERIYREILRRDEICPTFYIAIGMRPGLEIETYCDVEDFRERAWDAGEIGAIALRLAGRESIAERAAGIAKIAASRGFFCHHISHDLLGGDQALGLFFDHGNREGATDREYRAALGEICAMHGSVTRLPPGEGSFRITESLCSATIGAKIACIGPLRHKVMIEEMDRKAQGRL